MSRRRLLLPLLAALLLAAGALLFETWLARHLPENRVEVLLTDPASPAQSRMDAALQEEGGQPSGLSLRQEGDRWVVEGAGLFTARHLETALSEAGLPEGGYQVLDYSWAEDFTATAARLWQTVAAFCLLVLLGHFAAGLVRREWARLHGCLRTMYPAEILRQDSERLVRLLILFVPLILAAALLIRWLWGVGYVLPAGFLPEGSLFAWEEYSRWAAEAFPAGVLSPYAAQLAGTLSLAYGGACALSVLWIFLTVLLTRRAGQGKTARVKAS